MYTPEQIRAAGIAGEISSIDVEHLINILGKSITLPSKEEILIEAKKIYEEANNSGDFEAKRQAKTAQVMFIAGAWFSRGLKK